jgi:HD-GYP domain-containing protein (c-di-GMP phosphodiesterase class II)
VSQNDDSHYLRQVTALGDRCAVVTHQPIFSRNGIKLVDRGAQVTGNLFDKLVAHKLLPPIDECVTVEGAVSAEELHGDICDLLGREPAFGALVPDEAERGELARAFLHVPLPPQLAFKLTVAREQRPDIFSHAIRVAWLALVLTSKAGDDTVSATDAVAAGLFHDLGLLHIDPELQDPARLLRDSERQQLHAHPVIASAILEKISSLTSQISRAVREHHERLDGSGYPRALKQDKLGALGQVLAVADVSATLLVEPVEVGSATRLSIILRFNRDKLNQRYIAVLQRALPSADIPPPATESVNSSEILGLLVKLARCLQHWRTLKEGRQGNAAVDLIDGRMERLERDLADAGIDLDYWTMIDPEFTGTDQHAAELFLVAREGRFQLHAIAQEIRRRWKDLSWNDSATVAAVQGLLAAIDADD